MNIPQDVIYIMEKFEEKGFEAFVVGGCVRDYILLNSAKDWDITTNALPEEVKEIFGHTVDTGIKHGTITVILNKKGYEVTTYRIDGKYIDNRHPEEVTFTLEISDDLSRRDFTMNAIAYNKSNGFIDPFNGQNDIKFKIIKGVGNPDKRFKEDALRMMRAVRFSAQLGFKIEENTMKAIKSNASLIKNISVERIREEFLKLIKSEYIENLDLLANTGLINYFLPEINQIFTNYKKNITILKLLDVKLRLPFLLSQLDEKQGVIILQRLKFSNKAINEVRLILRYFNYEFKDEKLATRMIMSKIEPEILKKIVLIKFIIARVENRLVDCKKFDNIYDEIDEIIAKKQCYTLKDLAIKGEDLINIGVKNGKDIGIFLKKCLDYVIENPNENKEEILLNIVKKELKQ